jgi:MFS family permease
MHENDDQRNGQPTETSPLLLRDELQSIEPDSGIAPEGFHGTISHEPDGADGDTLERQPSAPDRLKQYEGLPEVKKNLKYIFPALAIGVFLGAADQTIIVSSYGKIGSDLDALNLTSWIATAYFLTLTSFQPLYGKLSDIFGRKACLLFAYTIFGTGCICCGLAQNMQQLILARAFAGVGGGGMNTVTSILFSDIVSLRERGKWQGYINIVFAAGASSGAPLGGLLADSIGWRWAFIGQGPMCLAAIIAVSFTLHLPKKDDSHWKKKLRRIDFLGAGILIGAVLTLLLALDRGSNVSWKAVITLVNLGVSIPLFIIFILVEMKVAKEPFAPGHIIFHRSMIACFLCNFFSMAGYLAALFYIPLYFQAVDGFSPTGAGLRLIPSIIFSVFGSLFGGFYMQKTGRFYWLTVICYAQLTLGMIIVTLTSGVLIDSTLLIIVGMSIAAFGNGVGVTSTLIGLIANASHDDQAIATACSYLFRSLGSVFGISMSATVANQALRNNLAKELPKLGLPEKKAADIADGVRQSLAYLRRLEPDVRALVVDCYAKSTTAAFVLQVGLLAGAAISAWWIKEKALSR